MGIQRSGGACTPVGRGVTPPATRGASPLERDSMEFHHSALMTGTPLLAPAREGLFASRPNEALA